MTPEAAGAPASPADDARLAAARRLILAHGWNATAYQLLNPGMRLWFAAAGDGVVGYVDAGRRRVVAGAPVCAAERLAAVADEFERGAAAEGRRVVYFGAGHRLEQQLAARRDRAVVLLGAQPVWSPAAFGGIVQRHASLRAQLARARNKGVRVEEWGAGRATADAALRRVLGEWLRTRGLPPLTFLVEPETLGRLFDRRVFVALLDGVPAAFLVASPVPARRGWLVEQLVRGDRAPNGANELLVAQAMATLAADGAEYATLGLAPLSRRADIPPSPTPPWLRLTLHWVRAHGRRFYDFEGLDAFKAKLRPQGWEPIYAISGERRFSPVTLHAVAAAFSGGSPTALVARALWRAARQELRWAVRPAR